MVDIDVVGKGLRGDHVVRSWRDRFFHHLDQAVVQAALRFDSVFVERIDVGLDHDNLQRIPGLLIGDIADFGTENRNEDQQCRGEGAPASLPYAGTVHRQEDSRIAQQDPGGTAYGADDLIPLHEPGRHGEGVAQAEPGPGEFDLEIDMFPGQPGKDEEQQGESFCCEGTFHLFADPAGTPAIDGENGCHLQGVQENGCDGSCT